MTVVELLTLWSDRKAAEQFTEQSDHFNATEVMDHQQQQTIDCYKLFNIKHYFNSQICVTILLLFAYQMTLESVRSASSPSISCLTRSCISGCRAKAYNIQLVPLAVVSCPVIRHHVCLLLTYETTFELQEIFEWLDPSKLCLNVTIKSKSMLFHMPQRVAC